MTFDMIFMGCDAVQTHRQMQTVCFSETMVSTYESTQHHNPQEQQCHVSHNFSDFKIPYNPP
jgi:hypothetical protein